MLKRIFSESLFYVLGAHLPRIVSLLLLPVFTRYLTSTDYGISATVMVYTGMLLGIKDLGISVLVVNTFYHFRKTWVLRWRIYYGYLLAWSPVLFLISFLLVYFTLPSEALNNKLLTVVLVSSPYLFFEHTILMGFRYLQIVTRDARKVAIISFVSAAVTLLTTYYFIVEIKAGYLGWFIGSFAGSLASGVLYLIIILKAGIKPVFYHNIKFFLKEMKVALPMIPHNYASFLMKFSDRFVMSTLNVPVQQMGLYNLAYSFGNYVDVLTNSLGLAVGPVINDQVSEKKVKAEHALRRLIFFLQALFIFGLAAITVWFREIFAWLISNEELQGVYPLAIIIVMAFAFRPAAWAVSNRLLLAKKTGKIWRISFMAGLLNVMLNFILIPVFGYQVAALNILISFLVLGFGGLVLKDLKEQGMPGYSPGLWLILILGFTACSYFLRDSSVNIKALYSGLLLLLMALSYWWYRQGNSARLNAPYKDSF